MSDVAPAKRQRSAINALKILNKLRSERKLPKAKTKIRAVKTVTKILITAEVKEAVTLQEIQNLYPAALTEANYVFTSEQGKKLSKDVEFRLNRIKQGKEPLPSVTPAKARKAN